MLHIKLTAVPIIIRAHGLKNSAKWLGDLKTLLWQIHRSNYHHRLNLLNVINLGLCSTSAHTIQQVLSQGAAYSS